MKVINIFLYLFLPVVLQVMQEFPNAKKNNLMFPEFYQFSMKSTR